MRALPLLVLLATAACGGSAVNYPPAAPRPPASPQEPAVADARAKFEAGIAALVEHDAANDWSPATCEAVSGMFDAAVRARGGTFPEASYDAGLVWQRCGDAERASARFEAAPGFAPAQAKAALYRYRRDRNADAAIATLERAVVASEFTNVAALVDLAAMQMARRSGAAGTGCQDDMDCARLNLQRALAIDDAYMPAMNQLALYYLQKAKAQKKRADVQQLELAALVCAQAMKKTASYAPIHNTAGLVQAELGQINGAVASFAAARRLDPRFFEAHMNLAAVNLGFRGFDQAERAYRKALEMRPNDYDAHIGLAIALRGPLVGDEPDYATRIEAVEKEIEAAKRIDPERPEAWFNEGILTQEFKARPGVPPEEARAALRSAEASFKRFFEKAKDKPGYEAAREKGYAHLADVEATHSFILIMQP